MAQAAKKETTLRAVLEFISGKNASSSLKLRRDATIFGREKGDILIEDTEVSSTHCQIQCIENSYHIFDMNSTNGTFVNSERIVKAKLKDGDTVTLGSTSFRFGLKSENEVRNVATIFQTKSSQQTNSSIVDTLIESELRSTQSRAVTLKIRYRNGMSEEVTLKQRLIYVGRASSFGHFDQDSEISRKHLLIKLNDNGEIFIEDQGSTNGTFLNGKKISGMHLVTPQDEIKVGGIHISVSTQDK